MERTHDVPFETRLGELDTFADGPPHALFARMREEAPAIWTDAPASWPAPDQPGFWSVTRAADVVAISKDPEAFSSWRGGFTMRQDELGSLDVQRATMIGKDGAEHARMRGTVNRAFTPRQLARLTDTTRRRVERLLDDPLRAGSCDLATDLAGPLATATICDLLGVPEADRAQLARWTDAFLSADDEIAGGLRGDEALLLSGEYFAGLVAERGRCPADDLITALGQARYRGAEMPLEEQVGVFAQLFAAGIDSTKNTITNGVLTLLEHPDQLALLREDPGLVPSAVEEILRWTPPFTHMRRTATRDVELHGARIAEGESVVMWLQAASRDPQAIDRPDVFDVARGAGCPHLAFGGGGRHFCLGAGLARLELTTFFAVLLERTSALALTGRPERIRSCFVDGFKHVPLAVAAAERRGVAA